MADYYSIKAAVFSFLKAQAITPYIYHRELPQNPSYPATIYDVIDDVTVCHTYDKVVGPRRARVQLDVIGETSDIDAIEEAMEKYYVVMAGFSGSLGVAGYEDVAIFDGGANPIYDFRSEFSMMESEPLLKNLEVRSRDFMFLY